MSRVLVVTSVHPSGDPRILERTVASLAEAMPVRHASRGPRPPTPQPTGGWAAGPPEWRGLAGGRALRAARAFREMLRPDVHVLSVHDPELVPLALLASALRGIPVVVDVHEDLLARWDRGGGGTGAGCPFVRGVVVRLLDALGARASITLAEGSYRRMFPSAPVMPNHLWLPGLPPTRPAGPDAPIVYVGDITSARGVHVLLRATALLEPGRRLVLVGRCDATLGHRLRTQAGVLGIDLELSGWMEHRAALAVAARAAVGVCPLLDLPNYRRSLPTKVLEYLAVGVPVAASDLPGTREVIGGRTGVHLVAPADPEALAVGIAEALQDGERAATQAAASSVRDDFRFDPTPLVAHYSGIAERWGVGGRVPGRRVVGGQVPGGRVPGGRARPKRP